MEGTVVAMNVMVHHVWVQDDVIDILMQSEVLSHGPQLVLGEGLRVAYACPKDQKVPDGHGGCIVFEEGRRYVGATQVLGVNGRPKISHLAIGSGKVCQGSELLHDEAALGDGDGGYGGCRWVVKNF